MLNYEIAKERGLKTSHENEMFASLKGIFPRLKSEEFDYIKENIGEDGVKSIISKKSVESIELELAAFRMQKTCQKVQEKDHLLLIGIGVMALYATVAATVALTLVLNR